MNRSEDWALFSVAISEVFSLRSDSIFESSRGFQGFLELYERHFHPLWPLLGRHNLIAGTLPPLLYFTLVSIGSMYGGPASVHFGTLLHVRLRRILISGIEFDKPNHDLVWLGQARSLTQVAALYFGQSQAFSYAQHLGGILATQARRMNLFTASRREAGWTTSSRPMSEKFDQWVRLEERRRLAFGILRVETYTSVLLNTRPLVSGEELQVEMPYADTIWRKSLPSPEIFLALVEQERNCKPTHIFSDIIWIALEREEDRVLLDPCRHELLLFGLQQAVWRFAHDPEVFGRFMTDGSDCIATIYEECRTGSDASSGKGRLNAANPEVISEQGSAGLVMNEDHLGPKPRRMSNLQDDLRQLMTALFQWKASLKLISGMAHLSHERNSILSSLLLYHLSHLRLQSPLEDMHQIAYHTADRKPVDRTMVEKIHQWADSKRAANAVEHAYMIWKLVRTEMRQPVESRANFNFLAFAGLHHAAVTFWTIMGACRKLSAAPYNLLVLEPLDDPQNLTLEKDNAEQVLAAFSKLLDHVSPGRWSSFGAAALRLSHHQYPVT